MKKHLEKPITKKSIEATVDWLRTEAGARQFREKMERSSKYTAQMSDCMVFEKEALLEPVTL